MSSGQACWGGCGMLDDECECYKRREQRQVSGGVAAHAGHDVTGIGSGAKVVYCRDCQVHVKVGGR